MQCNTAIGVAGLLPFLGVSSLNSGPWRQRPFFLRPFLLDSQGFGKSAKGPASYP